jgi:hypothetical protein
MAACFKSQQSFAAPFNISASFSFRRIRWAGDSIDLNGKRLL